MIRVCPGSVPICIAIVTMSDATQHQVLIWMQKYNLYACTTPLHENEFLSIKVQRNFQLTFSCKKVKVKSSCYFEVKEMLR
jgi:hypothetical protein